jgi:hypothetical protein
MQPVNGARCTYLIPAEGSDMDGIIIVAITTVTLGSFGWVMYLIHKESR